MIVCSHYSRDYNYSHHSRGCNYSHHWPDNRYNSTNNRYYYELSCRTITVIVCFPLDVGNDLETDPGNNIGNNTEGDCFSVFIKFGS